MSDTSVIVGEIDDLKYFIDKRNRIISRGHSPDATAKVDAQLLVIMDAFKSYVETAIKTNTAIGRWYE